MSDDYFEKCKTKMGHEFGSVFYSLSNELVSLTSKWNEYKTLYENQSRVELLNKAAPYFAFLVQNVLWENIILNIAKITDHVKKGNDKSVTLLLLNGYLKDREFQKYIKPKLTKVVKTAGFSRELRNQWLAHKDFNRAIGQSGITLKWPNAKMINEFLSSSYELMNAFEQKYLGSTTMYELSDHSGGSLSLLYKIEDGIWFDRLRLEMALKGDHSLDSFNSVI